MNINQELNCSEISQRIWSGALTRIKHNLLKHSIELTIQVVDEGKEYNFLLICVNVSQINMNIEHPEEVWDYVELTEAVIEKKDNSYTLKCHLWSSGSILINCSSLEFIEN